MMDSINRFMSQQNELHKKFGIISVSEDPLLDKILIHINTEENLKKLSKGKEILVYNNDFYEGHASLEYHDGDTVYFTRERRI